MSTSTLTSKGQVTIPAQVRASLGVGAGDRIEFVEVEKGKFAILAVNRSIQDLKGMIRTPDTPVSIAEMNDAIARQGSSAK
nr:AbrB/MazE/SpoVT family DNA-binding domain-containing protein [uncultured Halomonas sp.]